MILGCILVSRFFSLFINIRFYYQLQHCTLHKRYSIQMQQLFINSISLKPGVPKDIFPFTVPAIEKLNIRFRKPVTFLVGENGSGKSTLLEALAERCGFDAMGGHKQHRFSMEDDSALAQSLYIEKNPKLPINQGFFFRAESCPLPTTSINTVNPSSTVWNARVHRKSSLLPTLLFCWHIPTPIFIFSMKMGYHPLYMKKQNITE